MRVHLNPALMQTATAANTLPTSFTFSGNDPSNSVFEGLNVTLQLKGDGKAVAKLALEYQRPRGEMIHTSFRLDARAVSKVTVDESARPDRNFARHAQRKITVDLAPGAKPVGMWGEQAAPQRLVRALEIFPESGWARIVGNGADAALWTRFGA